jgi:hypothetical protein
MLSVGRLRTVEMPLAVSLPTLNTPPYDPPFYSEHLHGQARIESRSENSETSEMFLWFCSSLCAQTVLVADDASSVFDGSETPHAQGQNRHFDPPRTTLKRFLSSWVRFRELKAHFYRHWCWDKKSRFHKGL